MPIVLGQHHQCRHCVAWRATEEVRCWGGCGRRFVTQLRLPFDAEIYVPKYLDLNPLKDFSDYIQIIVLAQATDDWIFERVAPAGASCMCADLTEAISDPPLAECNLPLDGKLAFLLRQEAPPYGNSACRHGAGISWCIGCSCR